MPKLQLLPAVDVADGQAVRLVQGEAGSETSYGDPLEAALQWQTDGAEWVHLVDLDAAFGRGSNRELLARVVGELDVDVELSGGIRDDESLAAALATGCRRVNLGTAALESPEWCARAIAEHGDRIAVGLDVRGTRLAARGWTRRAAKLQLLPAVDVADGQAVRLVQGEAGSETSYGDPLEAALQWQTDGAEWVHLVDLDAAFGRGSNRELLARVVGELDVDVELSGGIRDDESLAAALATGCRRVNLGTAALESPEWCARAIAEHGDRIAVGLDVRGTRLAARGWTKEGGELYETLARLDAEGCARYVVTDITKDGTLEGPNLELLREVCAATPRPVIASGGVSSLDDIRALAGLSTVGVEGAIVGKALYAGAFTLPEALRITEELG